MAKVNFWRGSSTAYLALSKSADTLYFITDKNQLLRGENPIGVGVLSIADFTQTQGLITSQFYAHETTGEVRYWDGAKWVSVGPAMVTAIDENASDSAVPTAKAVKDYVDALDTAAVKEVTYSNDTHALSVSDGAAAAVTTYVAGLVEEFAYNNSTGEVTLTLSDDAGATTTKSFNLPLEQALTGVVQHPVTAEEAGTGIFAGATAGEIGLLLTVSNLNDPVNPQTQFFVSLKNFVDVYTTGSSTTDVVKIAVDSDTNKITASISLNAAEFATDSNGQVSINAIEMAKVTGLEDALAGKYDEVSGAVEGNVTVFGANGTLKDTGIVAANLATKNEVTTAVSNGVADKVDKDADAVEGNVVTFDANGGIVDGGYSINNGSDYAGSTPDSKKLVTETVLSGVVADMVAGDMGDALAGKMDIVETNKTDEILTAKADGNSQASGKKVGGATLAATTDANTVATEAAVSAAITEATSALNWIEG